MGKKNKNKTWKSRYAGEFKKNHPVKYFLIWFLAFFLLFLPSVLLGIFDAVFASSANAWLFLAFLGALAVGDGLLNLVLMMLKKSFGKKYSAFLIVFGALFAAIFETVGLLRPFKSFFAKETVQASLIILLMSLIHLVSYTFFRTSLGDYVKSRFKISKSKYSECMKGKKNFWLLETLSENYDIPALSFLNKAFLILALIFYFLLFFFGSFKVVFLLIGIISALFSVVSALLCGFSFTAYNLAEYGTPLVLFKIHKFYKRTDSSILDFIFLIFILLAGYESLSLSLGIYGINNPLFVFWGKV